MPSEYRLILKYADQPGYTPDVDCYLRHGGYEALKKALAIAPKDLPDGKKVSGPEQIRDDVKLAGLRGRGGAGFSCGLKWSFVDRKSGKPIYLICNADESEPGTVQGPPDHLQRPAPDDRRDDHRVFRERRASRLHLHPRRIRRGREDSESRAAGSAREELSRQKYSRQRLRPGNHVHRGAGAYICGEETGLIESLEGKRAYPRIKPPYFPAVLGLYMCPTIVNNVETLCAVKHIVAMGGAEYAKLGTPNNTGTRIVSLSGHVKRPGYYEIEVGKATIGQLINDPAFGGGLRDGRKLKAVIPGGSSAKVFKAGEKFKLKRKVDGKDVEQEVDMLDCRTISIRSSPPAACRGRAPSS
jgi:NADH-quinone oxidoreductase subunit F